MTHRLKEALEQWPLMQLLQALLALLGVGSVLAIGAVHVPVLVVCGLCASIAVFFALWLYGDEVALPLKRSPVVVIWGLSLVCLLQLIPLPLSWLSVIAPANADVWARALLPFGQQVPAYTPISLDPGATLNEALRWFCYGAAFIGASVVSAQKGARWGALMLFSVACIAALTTIGHGLAGAKAVFGIYQPSFRPQSWHVGPLLNPNNLSGLLNLGTFCGLGLLVAERPPVPRPALGIGVAVLVGVNVAAASRGGVLALLLGVVLFAVIVAWGMRYRSRRLWPHARLFTAATVALGAGLAILGGHQRTWRELLDANLEKLSMVSALRPVISDFPGLGLGRGAFESVFPAYQVAESGVVYTHAENFVGQWLVEWGVPVTLLALVAFGFHFRPHRLGVGRSAVASGLWIGVLMLLVQNLGDLGLEVPAICIALAVALGTVWGQRARHGGSLALASVATRIRPRHALLALSIGGLLSLSVVLFARFDLASDRLAVRSMLLSKKPPRQASERTSLRDRIRQVMTRHPAEPYFPLAAGVVAWQEGDQSPIPWLQRVLERSIINGRAHLLLARVLAGRGKEKQALLELRLAMEGDSTLLRSAARIALDIADDDEALARAIPRGRRAAETWQILAAYAPQRKLGAACDRRALGIDPLAQAAHFRLGGDVIDRLRGGDSCQGEEQAACSALLEEHASALYRFDPASSQAFRLRARWLAAAGQSDKADALLEQACQQVHDRAACLRTRVSLASKLADPEKFAAIAKLLTSSVCRDPRSCAEVSTWLGDRYAGRGEHGASMAAYERAVRDGSTEARLMRLAAASSRSGYHSKALRIYEKVLARRGGHDPQLQGLIKQQRARVVDVMLHR